jgi:hypothetical protein
MCGYLSEASPGRDWQFVMFKDKLKVCMSLNCGVDDVLVVLLGSVKGCATDCDNGRCGMRSLLAWDGKVDVRRRRNRECQCVQTVRSLMIECRCRNSRIGITTRM